MISFNNIAWLYALPVSLLIVFILISWRGIGLDNHRIQVQKLFQRLYYFPAIKLLHKPATTERKTIQRNWPNWLHYGVFILLVHVALAQPFKTGTQVPEPPHHRDIIFLVDTSVSLVLRDYIVAGKRTDRMTMLKTVLNHFIDRLQGNRIGLIIFSESAYNFVPLTTDYDLLRYQIKRLEPAVLTGRTTDVSRGLLYALHQHKKQNIITARKNDSESQPVLVLISDVSRPNRDIDPRTVARLFDKASLRLHTITLGAASAKAEEEAVSGLVYQPVNVKLMQEIAAAANGKSFWANSTENLQSALVTIQQTEKKKAQQEPVYIREPLYYWPLGAALIWIALFSALPIIWRQH